MIIASGLVDSGINVMALLDMNILLSLNHYVAIVPKLQGLSVLTTSVQVILYKDDDNYVGYYSLVPRPRP